MIIWVRNFIVMFAVLAVVYVILSVHLSSKQRTKLRDEFKNAEPEEDEKTFVARGMEQYRKSLKSKLIAGVFVLPFLVMGLLIYLAAYV